MQSTQDAVTDVIEDIYEASPLQQGLIFHSIYSPASAVYNEQFSWRIHGPLSLECYRQAWLFVILRHSALRSCFYWEDLPQTAQVVYRVVDPPFFFIDLRGFGSEEKDRVVDDLLSGDQRHGFDLGTPPLTRITTFELQTDERLCVWSFHHAILDGWSLHNVLGEVFTSYGDFMVGAPSSQSEAKSYRDYLESIKDEGFAGAQGFWKALLSGVRMPTRLEGDKAPHSSRFRPPDSRCVETQLHAEFTRSLEALARTTRVSLNTILQAAWAQLLSRHGGDRDVVFGTVTSGRSPWFSGIETMVGFFVQTMPIRVNCDSRQPLRDWLREIQQKQAQASMYWDTSLTQIQEWSEVPRGVPLFETVQVLENYPGASGRLPRGVGFTIDSARVFEKTSYALAFLAVPGDRLTLRLIYDSNRFEHTTVLRMLGQLEAVLRGFEQHDDLAVGELPFLTKAERHQILVEWGRGIRVYSGDSFFIKRFERRAETCPDSIAIVGNQGALTYSDLNRRSNRLAHFLKGLGVGPEKLVAVLLERSVTAVITILGALKSDGMFLPLEGSASPTWLKRVIETAGPSLLVTSTTEPVQFGAGAIRTVSVDRAGLIIDGCSPENLPSTCEPENGAYVIFTSGSTGFPKGVIVNHLGLNNMVSWYEGQYGLNPNDRSMQVAPLGFDASVFELFPALASGTCVSIPPEEVKLSVDMLGEWLSAHQVTISYIPTAFVQPVLATALGKGFSLRAVLTGGDRLNKIAENETGLTVFNHYGPTECTVLATCVGLSAETLACHIPGIGRPIDNAEVYILGECGEAVPIGVEGEVYIGGLGVARGYLNDVALTADRFTANPFSGRPGERLYRTGDIGRYREAGDIEYLGRRDRQVKIRGHRVELEEVEAALLEHPLVREAAVVADGNDLERLRLVAYVATRRATSLQAAKPTADSEDRKSLWDPSYDSARIPGSSTLAAWNSSYTGLPVSAYERNECVANTAQRILALGPHRVLEAGCRPGLLLFRLAPRCISYTGTDFSGEALGFIRARLESESQGCAARNTKLLQRQVDDFTGLSAGEFDMVILNSVTQYFPDLKHLTDVLCGAAAVVESGGYIYLADVRSLPLLEAFHTSVALFGAAPDTPRVEIKRRVREQMDLEHELVVHPSFFSAAAQLIPEISAVSIMPKEGRFPNEWNRFRYDVVLQVQGGPNDCADIEDMDWQAHNLSLTPVIEGLSREDRHRIWYRRIPNPSARLDLAAVDLLNQEAGPRSAAELRRAIKAVAAEGAFPWQLKRIAQDLGFTVSFRQHRADQMPDLYDALFLRDSRVWNQGESRHARV